MTIIIDDRKPHCGYTGCKTPMQKLACASESDRHLGRAAGLLRASEKPTENGLAHRPCHLGP
jgi:hypothetical protein